MTESESLVRRAEQLGEELLSTLESRWAHVRTVARQAEALAARLDVSERDVVVAGAWLHDIGYVPDLVVTGFHAVDGACHLQRLGWPRIVCALVAFHTGARYEAEERGLSDALTAFDPPPPHLLDTLTAADVLVGPHGAPVTPDERIAEILHRYDAGDPVHRAVRRSAPELLAAVERTERRLALAGKRNAGTQPM